MAESAYTHWKKVLTGAIELYKFSTPQYTDRVLQVGKEFYWEHESHLEGPQGDYFAEKLSEREAKWYVDLVKGAT